MTETQKYLIKLSRAAILDEAPPLPPSGTDWDYILEKSSEQNISGLVASAVLRLPAENQPRNAPLWNEVLMHTMFVMGRRFSEFERLSKIFKQNSLKAVCLKGIVIKELYPVPELRTMGDFDILTDDIKLARRIMNDEGYTTHMSGVCLEASKAADHWEIFSSLDAEFRTDTAQYDNIMLTDVQSWHDALRTNDTYFTAHVIVHAAKHILGKGSGIRCICDIALILKNLSPDMDIVRDICAKQNKEKIYEYIKAAAAVYYGTATDYDKTLDTELFMEYLLLATVHGKRADGNNMVYQVAKGDDTIPEWRKMFFPPRKLLSSKYQYARDHGWLLPAAWVHRGINAFFIRKDSVKTVVKGMDEIHKFSRERDKWLKRLDIQ